MKAKNLLVIMSDEHNPAMLGCAGHPLVKTPNLDGLAARGTRFSAAYTNCPICVPARASFATGRYVHDIGYWDNSIGYDGRVKGWGHQLQAAGMRVDAIGKLHYRSVTDDVGFDQQHIPMHIKDGLGMLHLSIRKPLPDDISDVRPNDVIANAGPGESGYTQYDRNITKYACEWLERAAAEPTAKPWVLFVSFVTPHFPLIAPEEFFALYRPEDMPPLKCDPRSGFQPHPWHRAFVAKTGVGHFSDQQHQIAAAAYLGLCSFMDAQVGQVLNALEATGFADSTRVLYTSDHGENAGARGMWGKSNHYEEASGIPMILVGDDVPAGQVSTTPVSLIDAHPTILQGVGLPFEEDGTPGRSLFGIAQSDDEPERIAFSEYHAAGSVTGSFMLRRGQYKLIYYVGHEAELFDLQADPEELTNLAQNPAFADVAADLELQLRQLVDPEAVDAQAQAAQTQLINRHGGPEAVLSNLVTRSSYTPVPDELLT